MGGDDNNNEGSVLYQSSANGASWEKISNYPDIHRITQNVNHVWMAGKKGLIAKKKKY